MLDRYFWPVCWLGLTNICARQKNCIGSEFWEDFLRIVLSEQRDWRSSRISSAHIRPGKPQLDMGRELSHTRGGMVLCRQSKGLAHIPQLAVCRPDTEQGQGQGKGQPDPFHTMQQDTKARACSHSAWRRLSAGPLLRDFSRVQCYTW